MSVTKIYAKLNPFSWYHAMAYKTIYDVKTLVCIEHYVLTGLTDDRLETQILIVVVTRLTQENKHLYIAQ